MNQIKIEIGDYSKDGHGVSEVIEILCNRTQDELKTLYKKSCELTGLQFTTNGDESGRERGWRELSKYKVLNEYLESSVTEFQKGIFKNFGIFTDNYIPSSNFKWGTKAFVQLFFDFLKLSDLKLSWEFVEQSKEQVLQLGIGYGIYDN